MMSFSFGFNNDDITEDSVPTESMAQDYCGPEGKTGDISTPKAHGLRDLV